VGVTALGCGEGWVIFRLIFAKGKDWRTVGGLVCEINPVRDNKV